MNISCDSCSLCDFQVIWWYVGSVLLAIVIRKWNSFEFCRKKRVIFNEIPWENKVKKSIWLKIVEKSQENANFHWIWRNWKKKSTIFSRKSTLNTCNKVNFVLETLQTESFEPKIPKQNQLLVANNTVVCACVDSSYFKRFLATQQLINRDFCICVGEWKGNQESWTVYQIQAKRRIRSIQIGIDFCIESNRIDNDLSELLTQTWF